MSSLKHVNKETEKLRKSRNNTYVPVRKSKQMLTICHMCFKYLFDIYKKFSFYGSRFPPYSYLSSSLLCSSHPWFLVWHMFAWTRLDKRFPGIAIEGIQVSGIKAEVICTTSWKSPWRHGELFLSPFLRYASGTVAVKAGAVLGHRMEAVLRT